MRLIPFIRKEFLHILRDPKTLLILFVMPILLVIIFGFAIRTEIRDAKIAVLDHSKDELSIGLTNKLLSTGYFVCTGQLTAHDEIEPMFENDQAAVVIVFPADFSAQFYREGSVPIQIIADATNPNNATMLKNYIISIAQAYQQEKTQQNGALIDLQTRMIYNPELKDIYMFVPGVLALVLMIVLAVMTAVSLTKEKEMGTFKVLTVSPLREIDIIIGKIIPYLVIAIANTLSILLLSVWIFQMPIHGSLVAMGCVCFLFLTTSLSLGVFISSIANTQQVAIFISIIALYLPTMLLSGFIYPIENMPLPLQIVSNAFPAKWFIIAIKAVMIKGSSLTQLLIPMSVLTLMTTLFIRVSITRYKSVTKK